MAEKEKAPSYEASATGQQQKPASLQLPPLRPSGPGNKDSGHPNDSDKPGVESYYLNIAQKGKLMLPTALWVMLILAGICFLSLLVSLNKTIGSIETLVELEQEREARAQLNALFHPHNHNSARKANPTNEDKIDDGAKKDKAKNDSNSNNNKDRQHKSKHHEMTDEEMIKAAIESGPSFGGPSIGGSWFDFPSWTSLEPRHREHSHQHVNEGELSSPPLLPPMSFLRDLFSDFASQPSLGQDEGEPQVSASIFLTSGPIMEAGPDGPPMNDMHGDGLMNSLIKQTLPILDSIMSDNRVESESSYTHGGRLLHSNAMRDDDDDKSHVPTISAKIDNLNVHINGASADLDADERVKFEARSPSTQEDEILSLEKSIDDLVSKLIDQKSRPQDPERRQQDDEILPIVRHHHHGGAAHNKHLAHPDNHAFLRDSPLPPLASFDSSSPVPILFQMIDSVDDPLKTLPHPLGSLNAHSMHHTRGPFEDQDSSPLVISISGEQDPINEIFKASGETNRHNEGNTHRPPFGQSPYEVPFPPPFAMDDLMVPFGLGKQSKFSNKPQNEHHHVTKATVDKSSDASWDRFANSLADSLFQDMFPRQRRPPVSLDEPQTNIIDGFVPLAPGEQQNIIATLLRPDSLLPGSDMIEPANKKKGHKHRPGNKEEQNAGNTISLLFGPSADPFARIISDLESLNGESNKKAAHKPLIANIEEPIKDRVDATSQPSITAHAPVTKKDGASTVVTVGTTAIPQSSSSAGTDQPISQPPTNGLNLLDEKSRRKETEDIISNIMGEIFTTPQSSGIQDQSSTGSLLSSRAPAI